MDALIFDPQGFFGDIVSLLLVDQDLVTVTYADCVQVLSDLIQAGKSFELVISDADVVLKAGGVGCDGISALASEVVLVSQDPLPEQGYHELTIALPRAIVMRASERQTLLCIVRRSIADYLAPLGHKYWIRRKGTTRSYLKAAIRYIETKGNYCLIHSTDGMVETRQPIDTLINYINLEGLYRIHRKYAVNMAAVDAVVAADSEVHVAGVSLPIGRKYKGDFIRDLELR